MMFRTSLLLLAFMAAATSIASTDRQTYVVHMDKTRITSLDETSPPELLYTYETAITGFAAKLSIKQLQALNKVEGFLSAVPDELLGLHTTHSPQFLGLHTGRGLWNAHNLATDVIIGIELPLEGESMNWGKGFARGMRYTSRIAAYKACYAGGCANSDILAAIDQAVSDGVDVLSLSVGGDSKPYHIDSIAIASFGAVQNGVFVSCSAGNSGPSSSTVANSAPWIMTVAASSLDRSFPTIVKLGNGETFHGASLYSGKATKQLLLAYGETAGRVGVNYCIGGTLSPNLVKGKIVVCKRGVNSRVVKGEQVKMAGGAGMILLNTEAQGEELVADPHVLPAISLGASAGKSIINYVNSGNSTASIPDYQSWLNLMKYRVRSPIAVTWQ
ncbi:unnamed protein product, partial [Vitis vinifera]